MKTKPFAYLTKAPRFAGHRRLKPDEPGRDGDLFGFLSILRVGRRISKDISGCTCPLDHTGCMRVGRSLRDSRSQWNKGCNSNSFDGVLYRPTK